MYQKRSHVLYSILLVVLFYFFLTNEVGAGENLYYITSDHLGSVTLVTDENGNIVSRQSYYPYGETRNATSDLPTERQYTGQVSDTDETGLYYYNARYYNPQIAKFTQADTVQGTNRYIYAGNDPVNIVDPTGNESESTWQNWWKSSEYHPSFEKSMQIVDYVEYQIEIRKDEVLLSGHNPSYASYTSEMPHQLLQGVTVKSIWSTSLSEGKNVAGKILTGTLATTATVLYPIITVGKVKYFYPTTEKNLEALIENSDYFMHSSDSEDIAWNITRFLNQIPYSDRIAEGGLSKENKKWYWDLTSFGEKLTNNGFICQDYADLAYLLGERYGLENGRRVSVIFENGDRHRINFFDRDDQTWVLDATWGFEPMPLETYLETYSVESYFEL